MSLKHKSVIEEFVVFVFKNKCPNTKRDSINFTKKIHVPHNVYNLNLQHHISHFLEYEADLVDTTNLHLQKLLICIKMKYA